MVIHIRYHFKWEKILFAALMLGLTARVIAQPLPQLIDSALLQQPELMALEKEYQAALERAPQVSQLPNPEVGVGGFPLPVETRLGPQLIRLGATQGFPWPGTLPGRAELENTKAKALYEQIAARALELRYELEQAYYQLYAIEKRQDILRRNLPLIESLEATALAKVESGKGSTADVLRVQIRREELQQELAILEREARKPLATLNRLLQRPPATEVRMADELGPAQLPFQQDSLLAAIRRTHPKLRQLSWQQEAARQALRLNELDGKPSFGLGADYIFVGPRNDANLNANGRDIVQLRASVSLPIYREKFEAKEREEQLKIAALDNRKQDLNHRFEATIAQAYADFETARLRLDLYERQRRLTQSAIAILQEAYSTQGRSFDELLRLESELIEYDLKRLNAVVAGHLAVARINQLLFNQNAK
ncbi:TolC family protein [Phaeodactylibacter xiamenensis]|uniref:TolC family protein n=1 Tax=Phaeodactylibacter xiamenensis TaxID=1524460 RepID=UPI003BAB631D